MRGGEEGVEGEEEGEEEGGAVSVHLLYWYIHVY